jgi:hypothetical protein
MRLLGTQYKAAYERLLTTLIASDVLDGRVSYAAMWPMRGCRWNNGTLVVGRAVNGWDETEWRVHDAVTRQGRRRIVARSRAVSEPESYCPMTWVTDCWGARRGEYSSKTSAFWRTVLNIIGADEGSCWPCTISWSNLYKVAPASGGNPSPALRGLMLDRAADMLRMELAALRPRQVLVLAGRDWFAPFEKTLGLRVDWGRGDLLHGTASKGRATWVITAHPQGKNQSALVAHARSAFAR